MKLPEFQGSKKFADGWFFEHEGEWYKNICESISGGNIVEIGSFEGLSLSYIQHTIKTNNNRIYSVEMYCRPRLVENTRRWGVDLICKGSERASRYFPDKFFDLVYIDANHSYECVKKDIATWMPKLKKGGRIAGHDHDQNWPGVMRAVKEAFGRKAETEGRNWIADKKTKIF